MVNPTEPPSAPVNHELTQQLNGKPPKTANAAITLATVRCLSADIVQQFKGGHAGTAIGAAASAIALFRDVMRFNPKDDQWFGRDRFVLSAGHACILQYIQLHLCGYPAWTMDQLKRYHSRDVGEGFMAAGHPEIEFPGVEVTTGPLGQGIANSVGLAMAAKMLAAQYNKPGFPVIDNKIWCFTGDGCLQEGVGQEAISMGGHLGLDNLILIYDCNKITVDGTIDNCFTEDIPLRFHAAGWHVIDLGATDYTDAEGEIETARLAFEQAKLTKGKPTIIIFRTVIAYGSRKANTGPAHGQALGDEEVAYVKRAFGVDSEAKFVVPDAVYDSYSHVPEKGAQAQREWNDMVAKYASEYPEEHAELERRMTGRMPEGWKDKIPTKAQLPTAAQPTRKSSGIVMEALAPTTKDIVAGSADLLESTFVSWKGMSEFQKPSSGLGDYSGRQIRYGIREHSMAAIANGLAAYFPNNSQGGGILPVFSTFFMFTLYAAPAIRMAALQQLRTIAVATHDSIGIGEDGPTHQPIALASFWRALPGLRLWRPADAEETMAAWMYAIEQESGPSVLCFSRQPVALLEGSDRAGAFKGAYPVIDVDSPELVLVSTGSEVMRAVEVAAALPYKTRVVSMPCQELFDRQPKEYRRSVFGNGKALVVAIEAWGSFNWARYAHASCSMHSFGHSGPQADLFEKYGFGIENLKKVVAGFVEAKKGEIPGVGEFEELLLGYASH